MFHIWSEIFLEADYRGDDARFFSVLRETYIREVLCDTLQVRGGGRAKITRFFFLNRVFLRTFPKFNHPQNTRLENQYTYPTAFTIVQNSSGTLAK